MNKGKTVQIYLPSGNPKEAKITHISTGLGKLIFFSRKNLNFIKTREEKNFTGIYFLFGEGDDDKQKVYIGEADDFYKRLGDHLQNKEKEWFSSIIFFTTKDNSLNKALVRYFECFCIQKARDANRVNLDNKNNSGLPNLSESDMTDIENYFEDLKLLMSSISILLFEKLGSGKKEYLYKLKGFEARGEYLDEGFLIKSGSTLPNVFRESCSDALKKKRLDLINEGVLLERGNHLEFVKNRIFSSPSMAGQIIAGGNVNGWLTWKLKDGRALDDVVRRQD